MLEELVHLIQAGGALDAALLAKKLNTTLAMVSAMIDHLHRTGMIKPYQPESSHCKGCTLAGSCDPEKKQKQAGQVWLYEEKRREGERCH